MTPQPQPPTLEENNGFQVILHPPCETIWNNQHASSTRTQYKSGIKRVIQILATNFPNEVDSIVGPSPNHFLLRPIPDDTFKLLTAKISERILKTGEVTMQSKSSYKTIGSSISYWYKISEDERERSGDDSMPKIEQSKSQREYYSRFGKGRTRTVADLRSAGLMPSKEGKHYLSFQGYRLLARKALVEAAIPRQSLLAHAFTVICWNLMSRSITTAPLLWNNVGWVGDCMTITYDKSKTNQEGLHVFPRHIFANPADPLVCPVLALGLKLIHENDIGAGGNSSKIFYGTCGNTRYSIWMKSKLDALEDAEIAELGCSPKDIGTHSLRKGSSTYVCGLTNGPNSDAVKLRMDHSIGSTDDKYIHIQAGSDKVVGRCVTGLDSNTDEFCYLPPVFVNLDGVNFNDVLPPGRMGNASASLRAAIPFLIASVVHHSEWLENNLPSNHPYFSSKLYRSGFVTSWKQKVKLCKRYCNDTKLTASGVPAYALIAQNVVELAEQNNARHDNHDARFDSLPQEIITLLMSRLGSVKGVQISNEESFMRCFEKLGISVQINDIIEMMKVLRNAYPSASASSSSSLPSSPNDFVQFEWGNSVHNVPEGFKMPQENVVSLWRFWIFGCTKNKLRPLIDLPGRSLSDKSQRSQLSKARYVMKCIREKSGMTFEAIHALGITEAELLCKRVYDAAMGHIPFHSRMYYASVYVYLKDMENSGSS